MQRVNKPTYYLELSSLTNAITIKHLFMSQSRSLLADRNICDTKIQLQVAWTRHLVCCHPNSPPYSPAIYPTQYFGRIQGATIDRILKLNTISVFQKEFYLSVYIIVLHMCNKEKNGDGFNFTPTSIFIELHPHQQ